METTRGEAVSGAIRLLFEVGTVAGLSDGQLLDRFLARARDEEVAEVAFAALVERHGPMVLRACRARLGDEHDAQDAFQATFLILARKAGAIRNQESAASWLHGVARRVASCARRAAAVRRAKERRAAGGKPESVAEPERSDLAPAVREEVGDLPEKYRAPLMLCLLDGLTHEEAATRLGWPVGTVKTRVRRAKDQLRVRLTRRGLAPSLGAIGAALSARQASAMPVNLVRETARAALNFVMGRGTALLSASVAGLVELGLGSLIMTRLKVAALLITSIGVLAAGTATGLARQDSGTQEKSKPAEAVPAEIKVAIPKPDVPEALIKDAVEESSPDPVEIARLRLEIHRKNLEMMKSHVIQSMKDHDNATSRLENIRSAKNLEELKNIEQIPENKDFEAAKKEWDQWVSNHVDTTNSSLKRSLAGYSRAKREFALEEQRLKDLEAQAARPGPSPVPVVAPGGDRPSDEPLDAIDAARAERLDAIEAAQVGRLDAIDAGSLDIELLEMEVATLKQKVTNAMRDCLSAKEQLLLETAPPNPGIYYPGGPPKPLAGQALEDAQKKRQEFLDYSQKILEEARAAYLAKNRDLKREQRRLAGLQNPAVAAVNQVLGSLPTPAPKPAADLERRLSELERKLDLVLKSLEKPGREPAKEPAAPR